ncbi:MAG: MerR family transcriptional regulator [Microbacterium sp.]|uniref:MerR family transcriptional regulator n=1 Tax=Microbacterium sp. TaxID=51671 RepID=UPI001ACFC5C8|nr:MerR family transcriptional regulator [Microbacterium sp.]MBN9153715.1 MerR family transcriptional regulator [Microbacterium sp.]
MYTIGEFAAHGRVSVRMLRHYDAIGLLTPARIDERTSYRYYDLGQLPELLRITDLRDLGCGLDEIQRALDGPEALRTVLQDRQAQLAASVAAESGRLARVRERLLALEGRSTMTAAIEYKDVPALTVYEARDTAPGRGNENIGPVIGPLFGRLHDALISAGVPFSPVGIAIYEGTESGESVIVRAAFGAEPGAQPGPGFDVVELPPIPRAATIVHHGEMARIGDTWMALVDGLTAEGAHLRGDCREVYHVSVPRPESEWVTELQQAID